MTTIRYLTVFDETYFHSIDGIDFEANVLDFCNYHDTLFIAGTFNNNYWGLDGYCIIAYDGNELISVGALGPVCESLEVFNSELYAGGYFGVKKYLGSNQWEYLPVQPNDYVYELKADTTNTLLFIGGQFSSVGGQPSLGTCIWDGFNMIATGNSYGNTVWEQASAIYRGEYYVGCGVDWIDEEDYNVFLIKWNGESWDSVGGAFSSTIQSLEVFRDTLYIGGYFSHWGGDSPTPNKRSKGLVKLYMPDNGCDYLKPRINTYADTFYLNGGEVDVNLYNNNPYVDTWEWDFGDSQTGDVKDPVHTYTQTGEYNVQVTVTDGECVKTANKIIYIELGNELPQYEKIDMQVHPNPSSNDFTVKVTLPKYQNAEIKIAGLNGHLKSVIPVAGETTVIPTKGWKAGVYVCNLFVEGRLVKTEKLVFE